MHLSSQVLQDLEGSGEKPGGPSRVTGYQTRYGKARQAGSRQARVNLARKSRETYHVVPTASGPRDRGHRSLARLEKT
jgi:hypothetical protein